MFHDAPKPKESLALTRLDEETFHQFTNRHGTSDEVGRIATFFDDDGKSKNKGSTLLGPPRLYGLGGCGRMAVVVCLTIHKNVSDDGHSCRLDSVITHPKLRKRGLAALLVAHAFLDVLDDTDLSISTFHSHAVHPGTVKMLKRMLFSDPPLKGAPLVAVHMEDDIPEKFTAICHEITKDRSNHLKLNCAFCLQGNKRRARYWCVP